MKHFIGALLCLYAFDAMAAVDTSAIKNATSIDDLKQAYRSAVESLITGNQSKIEASEIEHAKSKMETNITDADNAMTDTSSDDDEDNDDDTDDATKTNVPLTAEEQKAQQERIDDLEKNAKDMHDKEQSTANKIIGAAGIGLTGQGLKAALSGSAEKNIDAATEKSMKAYLETFRCSFGGGSYRGGETNIELPNAADLGTMKSEYMTLAAELKATKEALGLKPGIESEVVLDAATMGLHDDERHGVTTGAFTSVSRALTDENSKDATAFNEQKSSAEKKAKTGTAMAGVGAIGGIVGNAIINKDAPEERSGEINREFNEKRTTLP